MSHPNPDYNEDDIIDGQIEDMLIEKHDRSELLDKTYLSNCCGAPAYAETDICSDCKEHCGVEIECEVCEEMFPEDEMANNKRCQTCFEEFGMEWPDRI